MFRSEFPSPLTVLFTANLCAFRSQVNGLTESLEAVCDEIKSVTNFNTFVLTGGPTPMGTGGFQLFQ